MRLTMTKFKPGDVVKAKDGELVTDNYSTELNGLAIFGEPLENGKFFLAGVDGNGVARQAFSAHPSQLELVMRGDHKDKQEPKMKPGDYIELSDIKGPEHHQRIRDAVRDMGYRVSRYFGRYDSNLKYHCPRLFLRPDGDLIWGRQCEGQQGRINPDDLLGKPTPELPPVGEWQPWNGGEECPVPSDSKVKVLLKDGDYIFTKKAKEWVWDHHGEPDDIIAYCVTEYPPEPKRVSVPVPSGVYRTGCSDTDDGTKYTLHIEYDTIDEAQESYKALKGGQ